MKEILLTSSVLILALLLLRLLFRKTISRRVQYALWGLVALRLLVPVSLPAMEHNVLTAAEPVTTLTTKAERKILQQAKEEFVAETVRREEPDTEE